MTSLRVGMAQVNPTVGDLDGNAHLVRSFMKKAEDLDVDLLAFPEMVITGYPPLDLLPPKEIRTQKGNLPIGPLEFISKNRSLTERLAKQAPELVSVLGFVDYDRSDIYNAAAVCHNGKIVQVVHKTLLPTYDVFDELRYFKPAARNNPATVTVAGKRIKLGVSICEDLWDEELRYDRHVIGDLVQKKADIIININASPFYVGKRLVREKLLKSKATALNRPFFYVNMVGGQDELVFDGESLAVDSRGELVGIGRSFEEDLVVVDLELKAGIAPSVKSPRYNREESIFMALVLGVRDYFRKTGFKKAVIGLSGGIDSALTAAIGLEALGRENVVGVSMPSRYSSDHSKRDAELLSKNLGITYLSVPIDEILKAYEKTLETPFERRPADVAEENIQARIRGNILMGLSNKFGYLVLNTGNKTELALGYCTLYGDMSGGLAAIGDVSKSEVYALAEYYNRRRGFEAIPKSSITKIPSAELKPDQYDPFDYSVVSPLVDEIIENRRSIKELVRLGYGHKLAEETLSRVRSAEYKRRQAAPAIKISRKAFGIGWRMPIVNRSREEQL
ncbi:MAG TPA: NAD+ synthase [Candidatus Acidoferrum sp.]|nr:NAD+ synthase [Candidatus Acidoferrum sp.]